MDKWNQDYADEVTEIENYLQRIYLTWMDIEIDCMKERPESLDELHEALDELASALVNFENEVECINEDND